MSDSGLQHLIWRKSSYSGAGNDCVEVASLHDCTAVRDSKATGGGVLKFDKTNWAAFLRTATNTSGW